MIWEAVDTSMDVGFDELCRMSKKKEEEEEKLLKTSCPSQLGTKLHSHSRRGWGDSLSVYQFQEFAPLCVRAPSAFLVKARTHDRRHGGERVSNPMHSIRSSTGMILTRVSGILQQSRLFRS